jgi:hypothetical protein
MNLQPRVYLAAAYSRKAEIKTIADELIHLGVDVQARWLQEPNGGPNASPEFLRERAEIDEEDVMCADVLIRFTDNLDKLYVPSYLATGARMVEMGMARANGAEIIVVGGHQCVFDYWEEVIHVATVEELKMYLLAPVLTDMPEF